MNKLVVVGGGTAGCLSALLFKNKNPDLDVTMISSSAIGILGPGEGLTPNIHDVLDALGIPLETFIKETGGTIKNGIKFINWGTSSNSWFHGFYDIALDEKNIFSSNNKNALVGKTPQHSALLTDSGKSFFKNYNVAVNLNKNIDEINYASQLSYLNKIDLSNKRDFALHIDSRKMVEFLEKECVSRGIKIIDAIVTEIIDDCSGNVSKLILDSNTSLDCDFVIDCTGFKRLIIGQHYGSEWISVDHFLPATNAIACKLPLNGDINPYTEAIAMDFGWAWKIPLQHRYGCGYVYDSKYINKDDAEKELRSVMGDDLEVVGSFSFKPGFFKESWIKNCLAIGISSVFFEPLEATAIANMIHRINAFLNNCYKDNIINNSHESRLEYNLDSVKNNESVAAFLYLHYLTNKTNTDFWKNFKNDHPVPQFTHLDIQKFLDKMGDNVYYEEILTPPSWKLYSWMSIYAGNELHKKNDVVDKDDLYVYNRIVHEILDKVNKQQSYIEYINKIKGEKL